MARVDQELPALAISPRHGQGYAGWRSSRLHAGEREVQFFVDGLPMRARQGECLAVALAACGAQVLRHSPGAGTARGMFCLMGSCQECLVHLDDAPVLACMESVVSGMRVTLDRFRQERSAHKEHD